MSVSNDERDYEHSKLYCADRGMTIASIHTQGDADALEHLLSKPTYLGATETNGRAACESGTSTEHRRTAGDAMSLVACGPTEACSRSACCAGAHQGDWAWEDGTPFDFVHVQSEFANIDCTYCGDADGYHLMSDETRIAAVPSEEHWDQGLAAAQIRGHMSHDTAHNVTGIATYHKWGTRHGKKLDRGWCATLKHLIFRACLNSSRVSACLSRLLLLPKPCRAASAF